LNGLILLSGFKRLFSGQGLVELLKALLKIALIGYVAYAFLKSRINDFIWLGNANLSNGIQAWIDLATTLAARIGITYLIIAIADYAYQRYRYMKSLKMTKQEVKEDFKRSEGDPFLRSRIAHNNARWLETG
jgi:flagellar biosynthetic protein FlhB